MKLLMKILKNIILLPFLPIRIGWKLSAGARMKTNNGQEVDSSFARLIGTVIVAGLIYYGIAQGLAYVFSSRTDAKQAPVVEQQEKNIEQSAVNQ